MRTLQVSKPFMHIHNVDKNVRQHRVKLYICENYTSYARFLINHEADGLFSYSVRWMQE